MEYPTRAPRTPEPSDPCIALPGRRGPERLPCPDLPEVRYLARPSMELGVAWLCDLSARGVGLLLRGAVRPGAALLVQFPGPQSGTTHTQLARVAHATRRPTGGWLVGCQLVPPLADRNLARLRQLLTAARG